MFDIGIWELCIIGVVALLVVGPEEFPTVVRNGIRGLNKLRNFVGAVRQDLEHEVARADEIKKLVEKETQIAQMHEALNEARNTVNSDVGQLTQETNHDLETKRSGQTPSKQNDNGSAV